MFEDMINDAMMADGKDYKIASRKVLTPHVLPLLCLSCPIGFLRVTVIDVWLSGMFDRT